MFEVVNPIVRVGTGYDVHRLVENRKLILGGVEIYHDKGLDGHSDADVLIHAIIDAILGALAKDDIGALFPDTDQQYKGISSIELLKKIREILDQSQYYIGNIDSTIICQNPKLRPFIRTMRFNIKEALGIEESQISVKATTEEGLGFTGQEEGIAAQAICCLLWRD